MKKTLFAISAIAVLLGFTACTSENETLEPQKGKTITIKAYTEEATRTALDGNDTEGYTVVWSEGDRIYLNNWLYVLDGGAGTTYGTFVGTAPEKGKTYDVWYGEITRDEDGSNPTLPSKQTYQKGVVSNISNSPMHATYAVPETESYVGIHVSPIGFKNLCGLLRLSLKGATTIKSITISANEPMAGKFTINEDGGAVVESTGDKSITLDCGEDGVELNESTATDFYIVMPENKVGYTDVRITLRELPEEGEEERLCIKRLGSKPLVITRSKITPASFTADPFYPLWFGRPYVELAGLYWSIENLGAVEGKTPKYAGTTSGYGCCYYYQLYDETNTENEYVADDATSEWGYGKQWDASGYGWQIPSEDQWQSLIDGCYWEWTDSYNGKTGYKGYIVYEAQDGDEGKVNTPGSGHTYTIADKHIFLPAAGYYWSEEKHVEYQGEQLLYWTSGYSDMDFDHTGDDGHARYFFGTKTGVEVKWGNELTGFAVRPVAEPNAM